MTKLDHVALSVTNLEESIQWYETMFDFKPVENGVTQDGRRWAIIACNDSMISMTESPKLESAEADNNERTHRLFHFGLRIDDDGAWRSKIKQHSLKIYYGGEIKYPHSRSWYVHDPSGHEIEVSWTGGKALQFPGYLRGLK